MDQYVIKGGNPLVGEVEISGAKNSGPSYNTLPQRRAMRSPRRIQEWASL